MTVTDEQLAALQAMHEQFNASTSSWATEIEAALFPWMLYAATIRHTHYIRILSEVAVCGLLWTSLMVG
jgi:hypothetical protein